MCHHFGITQPRCVVPNLSETAVSDEQLITVHYLFQSVTGGEKNITINNKSVLCNLRFLLLPLKHWKSPLVLVLVHLKLESKDLIEIEIPLVLSPICLKLLCLMNNWLQFIIYFRKYKHVTFKFNFSLFPFLQNYIYF
jgi:hypothetical protein